MHNPMPAITFALLLLGPSYTPIASAQINPPCVNVTGQYTCRDLADDQESPTEIQQTEKDFTLDDGADKRTFLFGYSSFRLDQLGYTPEEIAEFRSEGKDKPIRVHLGCNEKSVSLRMTMEQTSIGQTIFAATNSGVDIMSQSQSGDIFMTCKKIK